MFSLFNKCQIWGYYSDISVGIWTKPRAARLRNCEDQDVSG
jgi:hypothetical protein